MAVGLPIVHGGARDEVIRKQGDGDEPIWVREGKWLEEDCVEDAEDGRGGADAEREGEDGGDGKAWAVAKLA